MTDNELDLLLDLYTINRWQIVEMRRQQNVMEHSFRVWLLATHLYDTLFTTSHNSFERDGVSRLALTHDAAELFTGDLPTPVKKAMGELAQDPKFCKRLDQKVLARFLPSLAAWSRGHERTLAGAVVEIADMVEAILYIRKYGVDYIVVHQVEDDIEIELCARLDRAEKAYQSVDWKKAELWVSKRLGYVELETGQPYLIRSRYPAQRTQPPASQPEQSLGFCSHLLSSPADQQAFGTSSPDDRPPGLD